MFVQIFAWDPEDSEGGIAWSFGYLINHSSASITNSCANLT